MWAKHLDKEETRQSLIKALGFDFNGNQATVQLLSFKWHDCNFNGTVCDVVLTAWDDPTPFKARWETIDGWMFEGDTMPDSVDFNESKGTPDWLMALWDNQNGNRD